MLLSVSTEPLALWFQVQYSPFWTNLALSFCLYTTWFLDLDDFVRINRAWGAESFSLTRKCQVSTERIVLDLESEVQGFSTHWEQYFVTGTFSFQAVKHLMLILALLSMLCVCKKKIDCYSVNLYLKQTVHKEK